jgi:hypothetical protein
LYAEIGGKMIFRHETRPPPVPPPLRPPQHRDRRAELAATGRYWLHLTDWRRTILRNLET